MKKIRIKTITKADKSSIRTGQRKHCVFLFSGKTFSFSNIKDAERCLVLYNDFVNERILEINDLLSDIYSHYRRSVWLYLDNNRDAEIKIAGYMADIDRLFLLMYERCGWLNGASMVHGWMMLIYSYMINMLMLFIDVHKSRNGWAEIKILNAWIARIEYYREEINNFSFLP